MLLMTVIVTVTVYAADENYCCTLRIESPHA